MTPSWLVTGAAGFIGSNLSAALLRRGHRVVALDNYFTGRPANVERLAAEGADRFRFVEADIRDVAAVAAAAAGCATVVHLAAQVAVQRSFDDPRETSAINDDGFLGVLLAAADGGAKRFIYASSCAVYGDNQALPLAEDAALRPMSPYAVSKLANELYATALAGRLGGLTTYGLRFFNVFGPWQDHAGGYAAVIPRWISLCLDGRRPVMFGDGSATRDFCFVDDICDLVAVLGDHTQPARPAGVYNIGTGTRTSLSELYAAIGRALGRVGRAMQYPEPERQPWRPGDILHSCADISHARDALSFAPRVSLEDGIARLLADEYRIPIKK